MAGTHNVDIDDCGTAVDCGVLFSWQSSARNEESEQSGEHLDWFRLYWHWVWLSYSLEIIIPNYTDVIYSQPWITLWTTNEQTFHHTSRSGYGHHRDDRRFAVCF